MQQYEDNKAPEQCQNVEKKVPELYQDEEKAGKQCQDEDEKTSEQCEDEEQKAQQGCQEQDEEQKAPELYQDEEKMGKHCRDEDEKTSEQYQDEEQNAQQERQHIEQKAPEQRKSVNKPITPPPIDGVPRFSLLELIREKQLGTGDAKANSNFSCGENAFADYRALGAAPTGGTTLAMVIRRSDGAKKPTGIIRRCMKALNQMVKAKHGSKKNVPFNHV